MNSATMLNLSILTSDLWAVVLRIYFYRQKVQFQTFLYLIPGKLLNDQIPINLHLILFWMYLNRKNVFHFIKLVSPIRVWHGVKLHLQVDWSYYLSFATVTIGLIIYSREYALFLVLNFFIFYLSHKSIRLHISHTRNHTKCIHLMPLLSPSWKSIYHL